MFKASAPIKNTDLAFKTQKPIKNSRETVPLRGFWQSFGKAAVWCTTFRWLPIPFGSI
jgi:hypothetical protein